MIRKWDRDVKVGKRKGLMGNKMIDKGNYVNENDKGVNYILELLK